MKLAPLLILLLQAPLSAAEKPPLYRDDQVNPQAYALMRQAQDESMRNRFAQAKELAAKGIAGAPGHPLGLVIDAGVRLNEIQEKLEEKKSLAEAEAREYFARLEALMKAAGEQEKAYPKAPWPKIHLGAAYGCRGLAHLYRKNYWTAYWDGKKGVDYLRQAIKLDKEQVDAYMGLGQFNYYAGSMASVLQFMLFLRGDVKLGLEQLELTAAKGGYAANSARLFLAKVLTLEQKDYARAEPYVRGSIEEFPENYHHWRYALAWSRGVGLGTPKAREVMERLAGHWDGGWRPPDYVELGFEDARLELAKAYLEGGDKARAQAHLKALAKAKDKDVAAQAQKLLAGG